MTHYIQQLNWNKNTTKKSEHKISRHKSLISLSLLFYKSWQKENEKHKWTSFLLLLPEIAYPHTECWRTSLVSINKILTPTSFRKDGEDTRIQHHNTHTWNLTLKLQNYPFVTYILPIRLSQTTNQPLQIVKSNRFLLPNASQQHIKRLAVANDKFAIYILYFPTTIRITGTMSPWSPHQAMPRPATGTSFQPKCACTLWGIRWRWPWTWRSGTWRRQDPFLWFRPGQRQCSFVHQPTSAESRTRGMTGPSRRWPCPWHPAQTSGCLAWPTWSILSPLHSYDLNCRPLAPLLLQLEKWRPPLWPAARSWQTSRRRRCTRTRAGPWAWRRAWG